MNILFLYLDAFRQTGGIEKFNKAFMKALDDISKDGEINYKTFSVCDDKPDTRYVKAEKHKGFRNRKYSFAINSLLEGFKSDLVVIGHLNLAPIGLMLKLLQPKIKLILIAHGIEVWDKQSFIKSKFIKTTNLILAVSNFTKDKILEHNKVRPDTIIIFHNTLDPFFEIANKREKPEYLIERYGISKETKVILTITRINKNEDYKGFDKVIEALPLIIKKIPDVKYILCGKYDPFEESRLKNLIKEKQLEKYFLLSGFIKEEELTDHYLLGDVFILPSKKEGFGIVFLEAIACSLPVIAGNKDGSTDALLNGSLGKLVDPDNLQEIAQSITDMIANPVINNRNLLFETFGFDKFKEKLNKVLIEIT